MMIKVTTTLETVDADGVLCDHGEPIPHDHVELTMMIKTFGDLFVGLSLNCYELQIL